jgi:DNA-binding PadR family transcriptional regulator
MSKTKLADTNDRGGWVPIIRGLVYEYGLPTAMVFGVVWRMCQRRKGVCYAAIDTIADWSGISRSSVKRELHKLIEDGFIIKIDRHKTTYYQDTGKAGLEIEAYIEEMEVVHTSQDENKKVHSGPFINNSTETKDQPEQTKDQPEQTKVHSGPEGVDNKSREDRSKTHPPKTPRTSESYKKGIAEAMQHGATNTEKIRTCVEKRFHIFPNWQAKNWNNLLLFIKERPKGETLDRFADWWYAEDWRGKQGAPPTCGNIYELWPQAFKAGGETGMRINPDGSFN